MRTQLGQLIPADRDIPFHMALYTIYKAGGRGEKKEGEGIWSDGVCYPKSVLHMMELCCPGDG